ncbi:MAG: hypothetical protein EKK40_16275 [Bradyrhizobiaceae bacterium]|nr:MAG: hypothetical protein EKK40_16275 [Bradyrhizobiaceae bacterium]
MLPGFRIIVMTLVLGTSILIFGLGAAALLRATHEEFASLPALRTKEQPLPATFAERFNAAAPPTLSLLRVEPTPQMEPAPAAPTNTETASLTAQPETAKLQPDADKKHTARRKGRKRVVHAKRYRTRAGIAQTRMVQRNNPAEPLPFLFPN